MTADFHRNSAEVLGARTTMAEAAHYVIIGNPGVVNINGNSVLNFTFPDPGTITSSVGLILVFMANPSDNANNIGMSVAINGNAVISNTEMDVQNGRAVSVLVSPAFANLNGNNNINFTVTAGGNNSTGNIEFSNVVLWFTRNV